MTTSDLLDVLVTRACKSIIEELKDKKISFKKIEETLEKKLYAKIKIKKRKSNVKLVRTMLYISDSSDDEFN